MERIQFGVHSKQPEAQRRSSQPDRVLTEVKQKLEQAEVPEATVAIVPQILEGVSSILRSVGVQSHLRHFSV